MAEAEIWLLLDSRGMGGIESHVAEVAAGLTAAGARPRVLFLADHGPHPLKDRLGAAGVPWECLPRAGALPGRLRAGRPAVVHSHGYKANLVGRVAALLAGVRHVASYHAGERPPGRVAWWDRLDRWTAWMGRRIAVSQQIAARIPGGAPVVPNFVALPAEVAPGLEAVGFVGRFSHEKGLDRFVALAAPLPGAALVAFGDGPELAACQAAAGGRVAFRGAVAGMAPHWRELGLLAVTSRAEGLPLAVLEAMAAGVPVAAFALGGIPQVIRHGENGWLAAPDDLEALAGCIRAWLALPPAGRAAMAAAARATIAAEYGRETGVARICAVYYDS